MNERASPYSSDDFLRRRRHFNDCEDIHDGIRLYLEQTANAWKLRFEGRNSLYVGSIFATTQDNWCIVENEFVAKSSLVENSVARSETAFKERSVIVKQYQMKNMVHYVLSFWS